MLSLQLGVMKGNVESRLKNYEADVKKFEARWQQLKPSNSVLDENDSGGAGEKAVQLIKDKKLEFAELETMREALEYVLSHFRYVHFSGVSLVVNTLCLINVVALCWTQSVLRWATVSVGW